MHLFDHVFLGLLLFVLPLYSAWSWRRWLRRLAAGARPRRLRLYIGSLAQLWLLFLILAAGWSWLGRPADALGFRAPDGAGFWLGGLLVVAAAAAFLRSWRSVRFADADDRRRLRRQLAELGHLMPRTGREYAGFAGLSLTAGVVEETIFRGWLLWYLAAWMPLWAAVIMSSTVFGLAHLYQGPAGIAKTAVVGLLMALLYLLTGSLWLPIVAHALVDMLQGATMMELYRHGADADSKAGDTAAANMPQ